MTERRQTPADEASAVPARRPLATRQWGLAKRIAEGLVNRGVAPDQISMASVAFAVAASVMFLLLRDAGAVGHIVFPLLAALMIQMRLLCNLFDGMVAVEGGRSTAGGELFNDFPDRLADVVIVLGVGYSLREHELANTLGWLAAVLVVMTAYTRTLAVSAGAPARFLGPMAKQHRMALLTGMCVLWPIAAQWSFQAVLVVSCLVVVCVGSGVTTARRLLRAYQDLMAGERSE